MVASLESQLGILWIWIAICQCNPDSTLVGRWKVTVKGIQNPDRLPWKIPHQQCFLDLMSNGTFTMDEMRGQWSVARNPYCWTDRHHDELTLNVRPKIVCLESRETHALKLHCHVRGGRFALMQQRPPRLTRGIVWIHRQSRMIPACRRGRVIGTFEAIPCHDQSS